MESKHAKAGKGGAAKAQPGARAVTAREKTAPATKSSRVEFLPQRKPRTTCGGCSRGARLTGPDPGRSCGCACGSGSEARPATTSENGALSSKKGEKLEGRRLATAKLLGVCGLFLPFLSTKAAAAADGEPEKCRECLGTGVVTCESSLSHTTLDCRPQRRRN